MSEVSTNEKQHQCNKHEYVYNESNNNNKTTFILTFTVEAIPLQDRNIDISVKKSVTSYDAQSQQYPSRYSDRLSMPITGVAVGRFVSPPPVEYAGGTGLIRPQCCRARCRLDDQ